MKKRFDGNPPENDWEEQRKRIIGLGDDSLRKSYYPELRRNRARVKTLVMAVDQSPRGIFICTRDGVIEYVNTSLLKLSGCEEEELSGSTPRPFWKYAIQGESCDAMMQCIADGIAWKGDLLLNDKSGMEYWVQLSIVPIFDETGDLTRFLGAFEDISTRKRTEEELERRVDERTRQLSEALHFNRTILINSPLPMAVYSTTGQCLMANDAFAGLIGASQAEPSGQDAYYVEFWKNSGLSIEACVVAEQNIQRRREICLSNPLRKDIWLDCRIFPVQLQGAPHVLIQCIEITEQKLIEERLRDSANHDELTRLPNRRLLLDRLEQAIRNCKRRNSSLAVLFLDLNKFKQLNDVHGHHAGDLLLIEVARCMREMVRGSDTVARLGGDEFVVLLEDLGNTPGEAEKYAIALADKISRHLNREFILGDIRHHSSVSIGVKLFHGGNDNPDQLLIAADAAMYESKRRFAGTAR